MWLAALAKPFSMLILLISKAEIAIKPFGSAEGRSPKLPVTSVTFSVTSCLKGVALNTITTSVSISSWQPTMTRIMISVSTR